MVVTYKNELAAQANMQTPRKLDRDWIVDIHDAVAVARDEESCASRTATNQAARQARLGCVDRYDLGGLALAPLTGGLSTAASAGAVAAGCRRRCSLRRHRCRHHGLGQAG